MLNHRKQFRFRLLLACLATVWPVRVGAQADPRAEAIGLTVELMELHRAGRSREAIPLAERTLVIIEAAFGPDNPNTGVALSNLAEMYRATGAYEQAEPLYRRALTICEKAFGSDSAGITATLSNFAAFYFSTGAYREAEPLMQRVLAIREKTLGPEHSDTANSLSNLAVLYTSSGAYARAEPLYQRALAIYENVLGRGHPNTVNLVNNLAELYRITGAYALAEPLYQRALAVREKELGPDHPATAISLMSLAAFHQSKGTYAQADALYQRALAICERALGPDHPNTAHALNNLAELYRDTGAYSRAKPLYQRALAIREKVLGEQHTDTATSLHSMASLYSDSGAFAQAEPLYQRALEIYEKAFGSGHPDVATVLSSLAAFYNSTGAYTQAAPLFQRALTIYEGALGRDHPDTATAVNNLAVLYRVTGAYEKAEPLYRRALSIYDVSVGPDHPATANSLDNLAGLYQVTGDYAKSEPLYRRALSIREKAYGPDHPEIARSLHNLASLFSDMGAYTQAELHYSDALAIDEKSLEGEHPDTAHTLNGLAQVFEATGAYAKAEVFYQRAQSITEVNLTRFLMAAPEVRQRAYLQRARGHAYTYVSVSLAAPSARSLALGLTAVLQYKGRVLDAQSSGITELRRGAIPEDRELFDRRTSIEWELSTLIIRGPERLSVQAYRSRIDSLRAQRASIESKLSARNTARGVKLTPVTLDAVRSALPEDTVLVEWFRYQPFDARAKPAERFGAARYVAYVLKRTGNPMAIDIGPADPIDELIASFRSVLMDPTSDGERIQAARPRRTVRGQRETAVGPTAGGRFKKVAAQLSEKLVKPLQSHIEGSNRWLVSPDGALNLVPFAAMLDEHGDFLAQHVEISYLTSGRDLLRADEGTPSRSDDVVLAAPNYGRSPNPSSPIWHPLSGTLAEANRLQALLRLNAKQMLTGDRATEAQLRALQGPRILHLATHGFFLEDQQLAIVLDPRVRSTADRVATLRESPLLRSGIVLAGANARRSGDDDGILTAAEVTGLDLVGTQLVVLSACETALGTVNAGDGVYGLRRALVLAGAQSQLVSLWKVSDAATQELMVEYYQRLLKGEGRAAALRSVQRAMLAKPSRQHPYYWAAFIPIGNWLPLGR